MVRAARPISAISETISINLLLHACLFYIYLTPDRRNPQVFHILSTLCPKGFDGVQRVVMS